MIKYLEEFVKDMLVWPMTTLSAWSIMSAIGVHGVVSLFVFVFLFSLSKWFPLLKPLSFVMVSMNVFLSFLFLLFLIALFFVELKRMWQRDE